jgi:hypothetical protein
VILVIVLALAMPVDCDQVKAMVSQHGKIAAYTWALANGYSPKEISRIRKVCGI